MFQQNCNHGFLMQLPCVGRSSRFSVVWLSRRLLTAEPHSAMLDYTPPPTAFHLSAIHCVGYRSHLCQGVGVTEEVKLDGTTKSSYKALSTSSVIHKQNVSCPCAVFFFWIRSVSEPLRSRPRTASLSPVSMQEDRPYVPCSVYSTSSAACAVACSGRPPVG